LCENKSFIEKQMDALLTASKWEILSILSVNPSAPLEIAKTLQTSIANVSQQLRLLEAAGLIVRKKIPNSQAGKPRALYSITEEFCLISVVTQGFAQRSHITLSANQAFVSRSFLYDEAGLALIKWFFSLETIPKRIHLKRIDEKNVHLEVQLGPKASQRVAVKIGENEYTIHIEFIQQPSSDSKVLY
jgi:predicted transcriptional regulator